MRRTSRAWRETSTSRPRRSRPAAARSSTAPASSSRSGSRRRRSTPTPSRCATRARSCCGPTRFSARTRIRSTRSCSTRRSSSSTSSGSPIPRRRSSSSKKGFAGVLSYPEELRTYPQDGVAAQVLGYAGVENHGLGGLELQYDRKLAGRAGSQTIVRDPTGRAIDVISSRPGAARLRRLHDTRPHDPGAGREGAARDGLQVGSEGRDGDRPRPVDRRGPRDGGDARLRREQHVERGAVRAGAAPQPRRHGHLRAGVDLQARHGHRRRSPTGS